MIRVVIADDQALIRESLEMMLNLKDDIQVVGTAKDGLEALSLVATFKPDVVLLDVRMPVMDGVTCLEKIRAQFPQVAVIVLSTYDDEESIFGALRHGSRGYLLKTIPSEELAEAIRKVHSGGALMNPEVTAKVLTRFARDSSPPPVAAALPLGHPSAEWASLNRSEINILRLIGAGFSNKEITAQLSLSEGTVRNYISSILVKLNLRDRTQVAIWAVKLNLVGEDLPGAEP